MSELDGQGIMQSLEKSPLWDKVNLFIPAFWVSSAVVSEGLAVTFGSFRGYLWHIQPAPCFHSTVPGCPDPCFQMGLTEAAGGGQSDFWKALQSDSAAWLQLRDPESTWHEICLFSLLVTALPAAAQLVLTLIHPNPYSGALLHLPFCSHQDSS